MENPSSDGYEKLRRNTVIAGLAGSTLAAPLAINDVLKSLDETRAEKAKKYESMQIKNNQCTETGNLFCHIKLKELDENTLRDGERLKKILKKDDYYIIFQRTNESIKIDLNNPDIVNKGANIILEDRKKQTQLNSPLI